MRDVFETDVPIKLKRKAFNQCVLPMLTYGAKALTLPKISAVQLQIIKRKMVGLMLGISVRDRVLNEEIRTRTRVDDVLQRILRFQ